LTNVNDFAAGTGFQSLSINSTGYQISGNAISVTAGVTANMPFSGATSLLALNVGGTGGLTNAGNGTLALTGANTYAGPTAVNAGTLVVATSTALGATGPGNGTAVAPNARLFLSVVGATIAEDISFASGIFRGVELADNSSATLTGALTLSGDGSISVGSQSALVITQGIGETGGSHLLVISGVNSGTLTFAPTAVNTYTGTTFVGDNVVFNGMGPSGFVNGETSLGNGNIAGVGTIGAVRTAIGGRLAPGSTYSTATSGAGSVGTLTTGNLALSSNSQFVVDLTTTGSDRVNVHGTVSIAANLRVVYGTGFIPSAGTHYRIIDNDGTDPVDGVFVSEFGGRILTEGAVVVQGVGSNPALFITFHGGDGNDIELIAAPTATLQRFAVGAGAGGIPQVNVYDGNGTLLRSFAAYDPAFRGGVRVATGDVNTDGVPDVITVPGPGGGPHVKIFDGVTGALIREYLAYAPNFFGGLFVATADLNRDHIADVITGAGPGGGPHVKVFDGINRLEMFSFLAYDPSFTGGVSVAGLDSQFGIHGSFAPGIVITGAGPGGGPHVKAFSMDINAGLPVVASFFAYDALFTGGVNVAARGAVPVSGDLSSLRIITAPASRMGPDVRIFNFNGQGVGGFLAYNPGFTGGVTVAMLPIGFNGENQILTGAGPGGGPHVERWALVNDVATLQSGFFAFDPAFTGGVFVG
jgi:autotransporter-associated beta strand protein